MGEFTLYTADNAPDAAKEDLEASYVGKIAAGPKPN
jgi:hypothetical protein